MSGGQDDIDYGDRCDYCGFAYGPHRPPDGRCAYCRQVLEGCCSGASMSCPQKQAQKPEERASNEEP